MQKNVHAEISERLTNIDKEIDDLLAELSELVGSEEKNRTEMEDLKEIYRESKRSLLAHRHLFGMMEKHLELRLENISEQFNDYDENTANGNYLKAREIVLFIQTILEKMKNDMESIPTILVELQTSIPSQIKELLEGYKEMVAEGYGLEHIQLEEEIESISTELSACFANIQQLEMVEVQENINTWRESIDQLYDSLEQEVSCKT